MAIECQMRSYSMFERFSRGYYLGRLYVEPFGEETPAVCRAQHEQISHELYAMNEDDDWTDHPLVMKLGTHHLAVRGDESVPADTLALPHTLLEDTRIRNPPTLHEVLLAKAGRARQLLSMADGTLA